MLARLLLCCLLTCSGFVYSEPADAASLTECRRNARVGNRLVMRGDDAGRVHSVFSRVKRYKLLRSSGRKATWRREGRRARTIRIEFRDGVVAKICQSDH